MAETKVPYQVDGRQFEGMIVHDDGVKAKRPVVFMQPDWKGVCADTIAQARIVAGKDYVVLMADMFGAGYGDKPKTREQLAAGMRAVHDDLAFTLACGGKAYDALLSEASRLGLVDATKRAAIGYCAGGGFALEQARAGADFKAVVVLHVTNPNPVVAGTPCNIMGRVLAIHGSADPVTPKPMMDAFEQELTNAKVDWQVMMFGGAVHSFCDPTANAGPTRYDEKLCRKSYMLMLLRRDAVGAARPCFASVRWAALRRRRVRGRSGRPKPSRHNVSGITEARAGDRYTSRVSNPEVRHASCRFIVVGMRLVRARAHCAGQVAGHATARAGLRAGRLRPRRRVGWHARSRRDPPAHRLSYPHHRWRNHRDHGQRRPGGDRHPGLRRQP